MYLKHLCLGVPPPERICRIIICLRFYPSLHDHLWPQNGAIDVRSLLTKLNSLLLSLMKDFVSKFAAIFLYKLKIKQPRRTLSLFIFYNFYSWKLFTLKKLNIVVSLAKPLNWRFGFVFESQHELQYVITLIPSSSFSIPQFMLGTFYSK